MRLSDLNLISIRFSYGEEGLEIFMIALQFMFPDTFDLFLYRPLSYATLLAEVILPEAVVRIIQADLNLSRKAAINTLRESYSFGVHVHPTNDDSLYVSEARRITTESSRRAQSAYRSWVASGSLLSFNMWAEEQKDLEAALAVKREEVEVEGPLTGASGVWGDPIDLTLDDD